MNAEEEDIRRVMMKATRDWIAVLKSNRPPTQPAPFSVFEWHDLVEILTRRTAEHIATLPPVHGAIYVTRKSVTVST